MKTTSLLASFSALLAFASQSLMSQVPNLSFETADFSSWLLSPGARATVVSSATDFPVDPFTLDYDLLRPYTVNPIDGRYMARLEAGATSLPATEAFLGLASGSLSTASNNPFGLANASAIAQNVALRAGTTYQFHWNFLAVDSPSPEVGNDFAFFSSVSSSSSQLLTLASALEVGNGNGTGWNMLSFTAPTTDVYRLGFGVANHGDDTINSTLYADRLGVAVPEPSTYCLTASLGCLGLVLARKRRRRA